MKKNYSYNQDFKAPFGKKFSSNAIDFVIIFLLSVILSFVGYFSFSNTDYYKAQVSYINEQIDAINDLAIDAKLAKVDEDGELLDNASFFNYYLDSHILLAHSLDSASFDEQGISQTDIDMHIKNTPVATYEVDSLAYFYVYYLDEYNGKSDIEDKKLEFVNLLKEQDGVEKLYSFDGDFPTLKSDVAINIFNYLYNDDTLGYDTYSDVANAFTSVLNNSISIFQTLPSYISLYEQYDIGYKSLLDVINIILVISYSVSFILIYILPIFFLQDGQSLGRKFTHTILVSVDESKIKPISVVIRYLFNYITYFFMTFFIAFIFSGVDSLLYASFPFYIFPLISFILCMVNVIFALVNKKVNSLTDVMSRSMLLIAREVKEGE